MSWPLTFCTQSCDVGSLSGLCIKPMKTSRDRWRRNDAWSTSEMVWVWSFISLAQSLENGKGTRYDESKDIRLMRGRNMPIVEPVWSTVELWGSGVKLEDGQKPLPSFYFMKMKKLWRISVVHDGRADRVLTTTPLCIIACYLVRSNIRELLIFCMAPISLLQAKNQYIRTSAQWWICI